MTRSARISRTLLASVVTVLVALFAASAAQAVTFNVNSTDDTGDASLNGVCDDGTGHCTLRAAIDEANNLSSDDTIQLEAKRYTITQDTSFENNNAGGDFDVFANGSLTIKGATSDPRDSVVSGGGLDRVFQVLDGGQLSLSDLSVTDGNSLEASGGGIYVGGLNEAKAARQPSAGTLALSNVKVVNNIATFGTGGGVFTDCEASVSLQDSHVDRNDATSGGGGLSVCGTLDASNSTVDGNSATFGSGGGILHGGGTLTLDTTSVSGNRSYSGQGGGISEEGPIDFAGLTGQTVTQIVTPSVATTDSTIDDNKSQYDGGGIYLGDGTLQLIRTSVSHNSTAGEETSGGGIYAEGGDVTLADSTVHSNSTLHGWGGGIYLDSGPLDATGTEITSNAAAYGGGGAYLSSNSPVSFTDSSIDDNSAADGDGGGIASGVSQNTLDLLRTSVSGNHAWDNGGGIYWDGNDLTLTDSNVDSNNSDTSNEEVTGGGGGGGVYSDGRSMTVDGGSISHNHSDGTGGGIYNDAPDLTVGRADVNDNNARNSGGGIYQDGNTLAMTRTSVSRNVATNAGGGIYNNSSEGATIANSTISGNHSDLLADLSGAGIYQVGTQPPPSLKVNDNLDLELVNDTIAENESDHGEGGGIFAEFGSVGLTNVLFANSTVGGTENNCDSGSATFVSNGHNLSTDDGTDCSLTESTDKTLASPKLGAIQNNSGPSETQALKDGSDAIDNGDDTVCGADPVSAIDQRGFARPFGAHCDIGAYETGYADLAVISNVDNVDPVGAGGNVTYTITVKNIGPSPDTATGVVLHNLEPAGTTFVSASSSQGSCPAAQPVNCSLGSLPLGAEATVTVTVKTGNPGVITDTANVTAATSDPNPSNDSASQNTTVLAAQAVAGQPECKPSPPRSSIARNGLDAKRTTVKLVGRTIDFRCLGQPIAGGIKKVRVAIALRDGDQCRYLNHSGNLTSARSCKKFVFFTARLGQIRGGKVPWTFRKRGLDLPRGRYFAFALGIDSQNNKETVLRTYNKKPFRIH